MVKGKGRSNRKFKFRNFIIPRYLPGSVGYSHMVADLREYNKLRYKCFTVKKKVDDNPPQMNPFNYIDKSKFTTDRDRLIRIIIENRELLRKINIINRTRGFVDTINPHAYMDHSKWRSHELEMKKTEKQNRKIYSIMKEAKSEYANEIMKEFWRHMVTRIKSACRYPNVLLVKKPTYDDILKTHPSISTGLQEVTMPRLRLYAFMEFHIQDRTGPAVYLGKILIELYQEYVPVTVQNFLAICKGENNLSYKNCPIHNVVKGQCIETGDITKGNGKGGTSVYGNNFAEENFSLKHTKAGVLSMRSVEPGLNNSQFSITLSKVEKFDGKRVVFGKVIKGTDTLFKIQDMARRIGKPLVPIFITNCGEYSTRRRESLLN